MVIDLNAPVYNNIRSVDHRSIDYIIFKNVKYQLGKKAAGTDSDHLPIKHDFTKPRWNESKLELGNIFSQITYYQVKNIIDKDNVKVVTSLNRAKEVTMSKDILVHDMNSSKAFDEVIKLSRTEIVKLMTEAKESVMTVRFHKKVDEDHVKGTLLKVKSKENIKDEKFLKHLSKELI